MINITPYFCDDEETGGAWTSGNKGGGGGKQAAVAWRDGERLKPFKSFGRVFS